MNFFLRIDPSLNHFYKPSIGIKFIDLRLSLSTRVFLSEFYCSHRSQSTIIVPNYNNIQFPTDSCLFFVVQNSFISSSIYFFNSSYFFIISCFLLFRVQKVEVFSFQFCFVQVGHRIIFVIFLFLFSKVLIKFLLFLLY